LYSKLLAGIFPAKQTQQKLVESSEISYPIIRTHKIPLRTYNYIPAGFQQKSCYILWRCNISASLRFDPELVDMDEADLHAWIRLHIPSCILVIYFPSSVSLDHRI
jgi:hypothetical protein